MRCTFSMRDFGKLHVRAQHMLLWRGNRPARTQRRHMACALGAIVVYALYCAAVLVAYLTTTNTSHNPLLMLVFAVAFMVAQPVFYRVKMDHLKNTLQYARVRATC